jgi:hypothetical protein
LQTINNALLMNSRQQMSELGTCSSLRWGHSDGRYVDFFFFDNVYKLHIELCLWQWKINIDFFLQRKSTKLSTLQYIPWFINVGYYQPQ